MTERLDAGIRRPAIAAAAGAAVGGAAFALALRGGGTSALPTFNAFMNAACAVLLVAGYVCIRKKNVDAHLTLMSLALVASTLFLGSYLLYHARAGSVRFTGEGWVRPVYFSVLISHTVLAAAIVPLVATVVWRAARRQFDRHRRIARWTLPLWLYVSVTGVFIYLMLYVWFPGS